MANVDKLPQEILDNIAGPHFRPSSVSAISRRLRTAVESLTFQKLSLQHLPTDREQARWRALIEALRSEPNHIRALNVLAFEINLQHYKFPYLRGAPDQLPLQRQQNQVVSEAEVEFQRVRSPHYLLEQTFGLLVPFRTIFATRTSSCASRKPLETIREQGTGIFCTFLASHIQTGPDH